MRVDPASTAVATAKPTSTPMLVQTAAAHDTHQGHDRHFQPFRPNPIGNSAASSGRYQQEQSSLDHRPTTHSQADNRKNSKCGVSLTASEAFHRGIGSTANAKRRQVRPPARQINRGPTAKPRKRSTAHKRTRSPGRRSSSFRARPDSRTIARAVASQQHGRKSGMLILRANGLDRRDCSVALAIEVKTMPSAVIEGDRAIRTTCNTAATATARMHPLVGRQFPMPIV